MNESKISLLFQYTDGKEKDKKIIKTPEKIVLTGHCYKAIYEKLFFIQLFNYNQYVIMMVSTKFLWWNFVHAPNATLIRS